MNKDPKDKYQEAFKHLSQYDRASLNKITTEVPDDTTIITDTDVDQIIASVAEKYKGLTTDQLSAIKAKLLSMLHTGAKNIGELMAQAETEASGYLGDNPQQQTPTTEQQIAHLWADTKEKEKNIEEQMREAHERHDITDEAYNKWLKTYRMAQALPDSNPHKADLTAQAAALAEHDLNTAADKAAGDGHSKYVKDYHQGAVSAHTVGDNMKKVHRLNTEAQQEDKMKSTKTEKKNMRFNDDEPLPVSNASNEKQALAVADATLNDVEIPGGGRTRISDRAAGKK